MIQWGNSGIVQALYNTPGSEDRAEFYVEFNHVIPLYALRLSTSPYDAGVLVQS